MKAKAIEYSEYFPVFPLVPNSKQPLINNGFKGASQDKSLINEWWNKNPMANIGIRIEEDSQIFVIDVDKHGINDGFKTLDSIISDNGQSLYKRLKAMQIIGYNTAGGGSHVYFKSKDEYLSKRIINLWPGIDILGGNGYVIAPPSIVDGKEYKGIPKFENIPVAPKWLITAIETKLASKQNNSARTIANRPFTPSANRNMKYTAKIMTEILEGVEEGSRDNWLTKICGTLFYLGMEPTIIYQWMHHINCSFVRPPVEDTDINRIFQSILKKEVNR